jgi:sugar phosphate isomerase/epimerase
MYDGQNLIPNDGRGGATVRTDYRLSDQAIAQLKDKLKAAGVQMVSYGVVAIPADEAGARKVFDFARKMGLTHLVAEPTQATLPLMVRLTNEYKIDITVHNHPRNQGSIYWDPQLLLDALKPLGDTRIAFCPDFGHWQTSGLVALDCLRKAEGKISEVHLKDHNLQNADVPWGTGTTNVKALLQELARQKFRGCIFAEYETGSGAALVANVKQCVDFFDRTCREILAAQPGAAVTQPVK